MRAQVSRFALPPVANNIPNVVRSRSMDSSAMCMPACRRCRSAFVGVMGGEVAAVCLLVVASLSISIRVASPACAALWFHLLSTTTMMIF